MVDPEYRGPGLNLRLFGHGCLKATKVFYLEVQNLTVAYNEILQIGRTICVMFVKLVSFSKVEQSSLQCSGLFVKRETDIVTPSSRHRECHRTMFPPKA